jgi:hypothetical protein
MSKLAIILSAILPLASLACTAGGEGNGADGGTEPLLADMEIGLAVDGSEGFAQIDDGEDAPLASGAQGGFHVWTAPRLKGAMGTLYLDRTARRVEDNILVLRASRLVIDVPEDAMDAWWRDEQAIPSFMCPPPIGIQIHDSPIKFRFELRNEDEELVATDSLIVTPRCEEGAAGDFCRSICAG